MLAPETMAQIAALGNVVALKDSSGDFIHFLKLLSLLRGRPDFGVLIGSPPLAGAAVLYGGAGAVPGVANIDPHAMLAVYEAATAGDTASLQALQERVHRLMSLVTFGPPIVCLKTALELMGICGATATAPLQPLPSEKRDGLRALLAELELL
jgi:4-hydroxy-tetrahydrodipicolinate synthase